MSSGATVQLPIPERPRHRRRWPWIVLASVLVLLVLFVVLDRVAVAYAENQAAQQMQSQGFPAKPDVTIKGFPFLTQVANRHLNDIHITANNVKEGPVRLSIVADATDVLLDPGYKSGTISHVTGTGLIGFSDLASAAGVSGAPGLKISAAGPDKVKMDINVLGLDTSVTASIERTGPNTFKVHLDSAGGLPAALLGSLQDFTIHIPALPMNLTIQSVQVTSQGVLIHITGSNIKFTQSGGLG
jgi:LmeA-like phospholipid-binding